MATNDTFKPWNARWRKLGLDLMALIMPRATPTITFVFAMFILRLERNSRRLARNSPSIFTPLFSQFNLLNMLSNVIVNSLGEMVSPCLTPLLILIFSLSLCRYTVTELSVYSIMSFRISMYTSSIPCSCNDVNIAWVCTESNAFS